MNAISESSSKVNFQDPEPCHFTKEAVDALAEDMARVLNFEPGDPLDELVKTVGGTIDYVDIDDWLKTESGSIEVFGPSQFTIYLSKFTSQVRDRFTLAHELGHYFLHSDFGKRQIRVARSGSNRLEWEANWFAAGFLMPRKVFKEAYATDPNLFSLAFKFGVSTAAAQVRIQSLALQ